MENFREESFVLNNLIYKVDGKVEVYRVQNGAETIVVKKLYVKTPEEANSNLKEIFAMCTLNHPSIVKVRSGLLGQGFKYLFMVMDLYPDGDLEKEIKRRATMRQLWSEPELDSIFNSLISGYAYMQKEHKLVHRDIKPQNILKRGNQYFIADLGCAFKSREGESDSLAGTPAYLSPALSKAYNDYFNGFDISNFKHNAYKSDVYSLGLTFFYMATLTPFEQLRVQLGDQQFSIHVLNRIREMRYSETIKNKIASMVSFEEHLRPDFIALAGYSGGPSLQDKNTMGIIKLPNNPGRFDGLGNQINRPFQNSPFQNLPAQNLPAQNLPAQNLPAQNSESMVERFKNLLYENPSTLAKAKFSKNYRYIVKVPKKSCKICGKSNQNSEIFIWNNILIHQKCFNEKIQYYFEGSMCHYYLSFSDGSQQIVYTKEVGLCLQCGKNTYLKQSINLFKCFKCLKKVKLNPSSPPIDIFYKGVASQCKETFEYIFCMNQNECGKLAELKFNDHSICFNCFEKYFMPMFNYTNAQNPRLWCPNPSTTPNINCCFIDFSRIFTKMSKISYDVEEKHRKEEEIRELQHKLEQASANNSKSLQSVKNSSGNVPYGNHFEAVSQQITPIYQNNSSSSYVPVPGTCQNIPTSVNQPTISTQSTNYYQKEESKQPNPIQYNPKKDQTIQIKDKKGKEQIVNRINDEPDQKVKLPNNIKVKAYCANCNTSKDNYGFLVFECNNCGCYKCALCKRGIHKGKSCKDSTQKIDQKCPLCQNTINYSDDCEITCKTHKNYCLVCLKRKDQGNHISCEESLETEFN